MGFGIGEAYQNRVSKASQICPAFDSCRRRPVALVPQIGAAPRASASGCVQVNRLLTRAVLYWRPKVGRDGLAFYGMTMAEMVFCGTFR
jgi:hypothetical protein